MLGAMALLAASCEKEIEDALPQVNPQEPIMTAGDVTCVAEGPLAQLTTDPGFVLHLQDYNNEDNSLIPLVETTEALNLPAGAKVTYRLQLSSTADFKEFVTVDAMGDLSAERPDLNYIVATDWNAAHVKLFGKNPDKEQTMYYRVPVYVTLDRTDFRYESTDHYAFTGVVKEYCMQSDFKIEDAYYFLSDATSWELGDAAKMAEWEFIRNNPDVSVYDDPIFSITVTSKGNCYWKIAPQSIVGTDNWSGVYGPEENGSTAKEGELVLNGQAGMLTAGKFKITINMETLKYTVTQIFQPEFVYTPGGSCDWKQLKSAWMQWYQDPKDDAKYYYYGVVPVSNGMKFCTEPKWNPPTDFGGESDAPGLAGKLVQGDTGSNINVPANGVYWCQVNYDKTTDLLVDYSFVEITRVGLIGSFAASNWNSDVEMVKEEDLTADKPYVNYVATVTFNAGEEYKIRFNNGWDYSIGQSADNLKIGDNIKVEESGTFKVTLHLLGGAPKLTLEKL